jgi:hypothetical protein
MPRFHEDSRNPKVSPDIARQHKMNTTRTNAHENERKRTSRGGPYLSAIGPSPGQAEAFRRSATAPLIAAKPPHSFAIAPRTSATPAHRAANPTRSPASSPRRPANHARRPQGRRAFLRVSPHVEGRCGRSLFR